MDHKRSPIRRTKRQAKVLEDFWDCSVCTYRNTAEAFKCLMCDVRKGTSTRKPRINPQLVAQQVATQFLPATSNPKREKKDKRSLKKRRHPPRLKNVDRSTAQTREVTVNNITVVITEYKPKIKSAETISSSSSSDHGSQSESSMDAARWDSIEMTLYRRAILAIKRYKMSVTLADNDLWRHTWFVYELFLPLGTPFYVPWNCKCSTNFPKAIHCQCCQKVPMTDNVKSEL